MNEAFEPRFELDECAKIGKARDVAADTLARHVALRRGLPRLGLQLLQAQRNFPGAGIDFEYA